ncbi:MAG TPA: hypothetical protein VH520_05005 [Streptosporangiaceae bacterium]|jgi:hypothetical protein
MSAYADHEAFLRRELLAAANSLEPRDDGLERIRARMRQPRSASARLRAAYSEIVMRTPTRLQDIGFQLADWLRLAYERFAPTQAPGRHRSRTQGLLRPLAAMAVVMFIVAAGTYVAIDASTSIFPSSSSNAPSGGPNTGGHAGGPAHGSSHASGTQSALGTGTGSSNPVASPSCKSRTPKPKGTASSTVPQPSASPSPVASPTDSASTDTASPADTSTDSPAPSVEPSVAPANPPTQPASSASPGLVAKSPRC